MNKDKVKYDALGTMWDFLQMGHQEANVPRLIEDCEKLRHLMMQKTAGQEKYAERGDIPFEELDAITNEIVIETMCLWLSGYLDKLSEALKEAEERKKYCCGTCWWYKSGWCCWRMSHSVKPTEYCDKWQDKKEKETAK